MRKVPMTARASCRVLDRCTRRNVLLEELEPRVLLSTTVLPPSLPITISATAKAPTSVEVDWNPNGTNALGFYVLRSSDDITFKQIAQVKSSIAKSYVDNTVVSGHQYYYEVETYNSKGTTGPTGAVMTITPLVAPVSLKLLATGYTIKLSFTETDKNATNFLIFRNSYGGAFTFLINTSATTYVDSAVTPGVTYGYAVIAVNAIAFSPLSSSVSSPAAMPKPVPVPPPPTNNPISVTVRYSDEVVVNGTTGADSIRVVQSGNTLTITGNGKVYTDAVMAGGLFIYTNGGSDAVTIDSTVKAAVTIESIDNAATVILSQGSAVTVWMDSTDTFYGTGQVHSVASFAGGVSKAAGAALPNPIDAGITKVVKLSLWGTGPVIGDVNQGAAGDCYLMCSIAAFAQETPAMLEQTAVDMGDGTYAVQFDIGTTPVFVRVNDQLSYFNRSYVYASPGPDNVIWAMVIEKAFCYFRTGANSYASIGSGIMDEIYADFNVPYTSFDPTTLNASQMFQFMTAELAADKPVTLGTFPNAPQLVQSHAYTLTGTSVVGGVAMYTVRNPWGVSGDPLENPFGYATITYAQLMANFNWITAGS